MQKIAVTLAFGIALLCAACGDAYSHQSVGSLPLKDWSDMPVPTPPEEGYRWELAPEHSDEFNYEGKTDEFSTKWKSDYFNNWTGPGLTIWQEDHSLIENGHLVIAASRGEDKKVNAGIITSLTPIRYPVYTEIKLKASDLELSSNFWLLSEDSKREIDVLEIYGGTKEKKRALMATTNFHLLHRDAEGISSDFSDMSWNMLPDSSYWRNDFHTFGVCWKSPDDISFFIDGKETKGGSWADAQPYDKDMTKTYADKEVENMDRPMYMIIDTEDHDWRSKKGNTPTDEELADTSRNKMYVDWIRTYKMVPQEKK